MNGTHHWLRLTRRCGNCNWNFNSASLNLNCVQPRLSRISQTVGKCKWFLLNYFFSTLPRSFIVSVNKCSVMDCFIFCITFLRNTGLTLFNILGAPTWLFSNKNGASLSRHDWCNMHAVIFSNGIGQSLYIKVNHTSQIKWCEVCFWLVRIPTSCKSIRSLWFPLSVLWLRVFDVPFFRCTGMKQSVKICVCRVGLP